MRVVAVSASLSALALAGGCGGGGEDEPRPAEVATQTVETRAEAPPQPEVPRAERAAAVALVSRYADALARMDLERACSLLSPLALKGGCESRLGSFARGSELLDEPRTVPLWDAGKNADDGVLTGRVKIGFPTRPSIRWTFRVVKERGRPWRIGAALPTQRRL